MPSRASRWWRCLFPEEIPPPPLRRRKRSGPGLIAGLAAVVVVAIGIGIAIGGGGSSGGDGGSSITEALAPKVTIGGQAYSTALSELKLADQGLTDADIQDLGQLKNLQVLSLEDNPGITDLSPLAGLTELTALNLMGTGATDLTPISGLTGLEELDLANPDLADLSPLAGLTGLKILYLDDGNMVSSAITDLSPLAGLTDLEGLYIPAKSNYTDFFAAGRNGPPERADHDGLPVRWDQQHRQPGFSHKSEGPGTAPHFRQKL